MHGRSILTVVALALVALWPSVLPGLGQDAAMSPVPSARLPGADDDADEAPELTSQTEKAIDRGLAALVPLQGGDGSWSRGGEYKVADTALVLMSFMVRGHFPGEGQHGDKLEKGLDFLLAEAKSSPDGYLGTSMYAHGLATLALSEVWGMTDPEKDDDIHKALKRAVEVIRRSQNLQGGWRYNPQPKDADLSVTVTQVVALASARQAGLIVPDTTIDKAIDYVTSCWEQESGGFRYQAYRGTPAFPRSAGATYALQLCGRRDSPQVKAGLRYVKEQPAEVFDRGSHYFYGHYYGIQAMVQASESHYKAWYPSVRNALLRKQRKDGSWSGGRGGTPQSTAMAIIVLGTPYRYIPIYQR